MKQCRTFDYETYDPLLIMHHSHQLPPELESHNPNIVYEPYANDTGVAVAKAAFEIKTRHPDDNIIMVVLPADHYIENVEAFANDITTGIRNVNDQNIVLFGIDPTYPSSAYGYIIPADDGIHFKEKPNKELAIDLIAQKALWNSGIFAATVDVVLAAIHNSSHNIIDWIKNPRDGKAASFDVAVLQEHAYIRSQHCELWGWSDVGSFNSFMAIPEIKEEIGISSAIITTNCDNVDVLNRGEGKIVIIGCNNLLIVRNGNNFLIMPNTDDYSTQLKEIATRIG